MPASSFGRSTRRVYPDIPYDPAARTQAAGCGRLASRAGRLSQQGRPRAGRSADHSGGAPGDAAIANNVVQYEKAVGALVTVKQFNITQFVAPPAKAARCTAASSRWRCTISKTATIRTRPTSSRARTCPPNGYNKSRLCDAQVDALLRQGLSTYDPSKRAATYRTLQALLYKELPIALIFRRAQLNTFSDRLQNQTTSLSGAFWNVGHWRLAAGGNAAATAPAVATSSSPDCNPRVFPASGAFVKTAGTLHGPGLLLAGGGSDVDDEYRWMHRTLTGSSTARGGNVIVLRAYTDEDEYSPYMQPLGPFQSVQMLGIPHCATRIKSTRSRR